MKKGSFPADVRKRLEQERVVLIAEGIPATIARTAAPDARARRSGTIAALALTQQRLALYAMGRALVDATWDSGDARDLAISAGEQGLTIGFDATRFGDDRAGRVEVVLRIGDAGTLLAAIDQRRRPLDPRRYG